MDELEKKWKQDRRFTPVIKNIELAQKKSEWQRAVQACMAWADNKSI
jgi:glycerol kinase